MDQNRLNFFLFFLKKKKIINLPFFLVDEYADIDLEFDENDDWDYNIIKNNFILNKKKLFKKKIVLKKHFNKKYSNLIKF